VASVENFAMTTVTISLPDIARRFHAAVLDAVNALLAMPGHLPIVVMRRISCCAAGCSMWPSLWDGSIAKQEIQTQIQEDARKTRRWWRARGSACCPIVGNPRRTIKRAAYGVSAAPDNLRALRASAYICVEALSCAAVSQVSRCGRKPSAIAASRSIIRVIQQQKFDDRLNVRLNTSRASRRVGCDVIDYWVEVGKYRKGKNHVIMAAVIEAMIVATGPAESLRIWYTGFPSRAARRLLCRQLRIVARCFQISGVMRSSNSPALTTRAVPRASRGKCRLLPVTRYSACAVSAQCTNFRVVRVLQVSRDGSRHHELAVAEHRERGRDLVV
jgi:hypothetical protein